MLSCLLDFSSCAIRNGFSKSIHICVLFCMLFYTHVYLCSYNVVHLCIFSVHYCTSMYTCVHSGSLLYTHVQLHTLAMYTCELVYTQFTLEFVLIYVHSCYTCVHPTYVFYYLLLYSAFSTDINLYHCTTTTVHSMH